ncbi:MAG TPA: SLATT domain-containing protein [Ilumatobacteraceae bacterium]|nr:SLATT domain-containing protein [Ilumatobacteraceae bacterium]
MTDEVGEFLGAYDTYRVQDQRDYYEARFREYSAADRQATGLREVLLFAAGACGLVAAAVENWRTGLGITVAVLSALSMIVAGWADVIGFRANAELYGSAATTLAHLRPSRPDPADDPSIEEVTKYIDQVEAVLLGEVHAWGSRWQREIERDDGGGAGGQRPDPPVR